MLKRNLLLEEANAYDKNNCVKREVDIEVGRLKQFRQEYPFAENLPSIEWLDPDKLFKINPDEVGGFFLSLESMLKPFNRTAFNNGNIFRNSRLQIKELRNLLRTVVDSRKSLAQKIDAPWERIGGLGQEKMLAKKIIFCFNYQSGLVFPIFSNQHLRHFVYRISETVVPQTKYFSLGQEYEHYTAELLKAKNSTQLTSNWSSLYFTRFLYYAYTPPDTEGPTEEKKSGAVTDEQLDMQRFAKLLGELQNNGKISGEQFREYRNIWNQHPTERVDLTARLKKML